MVRFRRAIFLFGYFAAGRKLNLCIFVRYMNSDLILYYKDRAKEYENIYSKPERQGDLLVASQILQKIFTDKSIFEIACGTGYWTEKIAATARNILATDINDAVIDIARSKNYPLDNVEFRNADIFDLEDSAVYENLFGGFIWSHIKIQELDRFIDIANGLVKKAGTIVFMDNNYVEGSSLPITDKDEFGNTYQMRKLEDGSTHKVLKNFPAEDLIRQTLHDKAVNIELIRLQYYWILQYKCP